MEAPIIKLFVHFNDEGTCLPDSKVEAFTSGYATLLKEKQEVPIVINVANELTILAFRTLIKEKKIAHTDICFVVNNVELYANKDGRLETYPPEFCVSEKLLDRIM
jgi:hypothetical protein